MEGMVISCVEGEIGGKPCGELTFAVVFDPLAFPTLKEQGEANLPHPFRDSIKEGLRNASEAIESTLEPAKEKASKWIEKAEEVVTDTLEPAKEKASKWIEKAEEVVTEKVSSFVDKANETLSEVESATKQAFSEMTEPAPVHPHPTYKPMKDVREPPVTMEIPTTEPVRVKVEIPTTGRVFTEPIPLREPVIESHHQHQVCAHNSYLRKGRVSRYYPYNSCRAYLFGRASIFSDNEILWASYTKKLSCVNKLRYSEILIYHGHSITCVHAKKIG
jgi:vacuolar-type H+-ATPase subunit H